LKTKPILSTLLYILWGLAFTWGVVYANNTLYQVLSEQPHASPVNDILSDAVFLFVAFMPAALLPRFFGYRLGSLRQHWKLFVGMAVIFTAAPLLYRLLVGETPSGANTWFFEGVVVPLAEEGVFRGILLSVLLWGFSKLYPVKTASRLTLLFSTVIFASAHLNNLGHYPTGFILFQVGFAAILGLAFGFIRIRTDSIYPAILLHALFNLAGTL
jgi:membrane protease YdiL (CAAX protease family)